MLPDGATPATPADPLKENQRTVNAPEVRAKLAGWVAALGLNGSWSETTCQAVINGART